MTVRYVSRGGGLWKKKKDFWEGTQVHQTNLLANIHHCLQCFIVYVFKFPPSLAVCVLDFVLFYFILHHFASYPWAPPQPSVLPLPHIPPHCCPLWPISSALAPFITGLLIITSNWIRGGGDVLWKHKHGEVCRFCCFHRNCCWLHTRSNPLTLGPKIACSRCSSNSIALLCHGHNVAYSRCVLHSTLHPFFYHVIIRVVGVSQRRVMPWTGHRPIAGPCVCREQIRISGKGSLDSI